MGEITPNGYNAHYLGDGTLITLTQAVQKQSM